MKHLFIINPAAGKYDHTKEYAQTVERVLRKYELEYEIALSTEPGDCEVIARRAAETGEELRIYACGGDGTLNEVPSPGAPARLRGDARRSHPLQRALLGEHPLDGVGRARGHGNCEV